MAALAYSTAAPSAHNDNVKPEGCTWARMIAALRTVGPEWEILGWDSRRNGMTVKTFAETVINHIESDA